MKTLLLELFSGAYGRVSGDAVHALSPGLGVLLAITGIALCVALVWPYRAA